MKSKYNYSGQMSEWPKQRHQGLCGFEFPRIEICGASNFWGKSVFWKPNFLGKCFCEVIPSVCLPTCPLSRSLQWISDILTLFWATLFGGAKFMKHRVLYIKKNLRVSTFTTSKDIKIHQSGPELRGVSKCTRTFGHPVVQLFNSEYSTIAESRLQYNW